jgi:hypothetical protein
MAAACDALPRGCSTICLPLGKDDYLGLIDSPQRFRDWLDAAYREQPELFPEDFAAGYRLKDDYRSKKLRLRLRRIERKTDGRAFTVRPSCALPYLVGWTDDAEAPLFLRRFGVPFWALAHVFGRDASYWHRLEVGLGRNSIVGTTVRQVSLPQDLVADEHHQTCGGDQVYIATVVAAGCCLGAGVVSTCDAKGLKAGYGPFASEARDVEPGYSPRTVNADGWPATRLAWLALFPAVAVLRCFLHGWLKIRTGCKKHLLFGALSEKVWHAYHAPDRRCFGQRLRRLREWAGRHLSGEIGERTSRLCGRGAEYGAAYAYPGCQRTSASLDRVMRGMNGYIDGCQHLHGKAEARRLHVRAWALMHNFAPWGPEAQRANGPWRSPAERLNGHRYHKSWLHNLHASASLRGFRDGRPPPQNP